jgi:hypothetical protein
MSLAARALPLLATLALTLVAAAPALPPPGEPPGRPRLRFTPDGFFTLAQVADVH